MSCHVMSCHVIPWSLGGRKGAVMDALAARLLHWVLFSAMRFRVEASFCVHCVTFSTHDLRGRTHLLTPSTVASTSIGDSSENRVTSWHTQSTVSVDRTGNMSARARLHLLHESWGSPGFYLEMKCISLRRSKFWGTEYCKPHLLLIIASKRIAHYRPPWGMPWLDL